MAGDAGSVFTVGEYRVWLVGKLLPADSSDRTDLLSRFAPTDLYQLGVLASDIPLLIEPLVRRWVPGGEIEALEGAAATLDRIRNGNPVQGSGVNGTVGTFAAIAQKDLSELPKIERDTESARRVLFALYFVHAITHASRDGDTFPCTVVVSNRTLAEMALLSVPTVRKHLKALVAETLISEGETVRGTRGYTSWVLSRRPIYRGAKKMLTKMYRPDGVTASVKAQAKLEKLRRRHATDRERYRSGWAALRLARRKKV